MSAKCNLTSKPEVLLPGIDGVVIRHFGNGITGGRTLDVSDFTEKTVRAGHIIVRYEDEDGTYTYKPLGVTDEGAYKALEDGEEYVGVVVASKPRKEAMVSIMDDGRVNDEAMPYPITDEMRKALREALPNLIFEHD